jgi:hypothetical protein
MNKQKILEKLKKQFIKEDKEEPFLNRAYVKETKRIFDMLLGVKKSSFNETDYAIFDIVDDIFKYYKGRRK